MRKRAGMPERLKARKRRKVASGQDQPKLIHPTTVRTRKHRALVDAGMRCYKVPLHVSTVSTITQAMKMNGVDPERPMSDREFMEWLGLLLGHIVTDAVELKTPLLQPKRKFRERVPASAPETC